MDRKIALRLFVNQAVQASTYDTIVNVNGLCINYPKYSYKFRQQGVARNQIRNEPSQLCI